MGPIDAIVNRSFRDTPAGRVVVFSGDPRKRAYLVRSLADEQRIRSFLRMFYFAHLYILVFGTLLSQGWASWLADQASAPQLHRPRGRALAERDQCAGPSIRDPGLDSPCICM